MKDSHSEIEAHASLTIFSQPAWIFRFAAGLSFEDIRSNLRKQSTPPTCDSRRRKVSGKHLNVRVLEHRLNFDEVSVFPPRKHFHTGELLTRHQHSLECAKSEALVLGAALQDAFMWIFNSRNFRPNEALR